MALRRSAGQCVHSKAKAGQDRETRVLNITQCCPETWRERVKYRQILPSTWRKHAEKAPLPDNDDDTVLVGCKNIDRFYDRTAGLFAV